MVFGGGASPWRVSRRQLDLGNELDRVDLNAFDGITASALLDLVSAEWCDRLAARAAKARATLLFALSVDGRLIFDPKDEGDKKLAQAFTRHQGRDKGFGPALGPRRRGRARRPAQRPRLRGLDREQQLADRPRRSCHARRPDRRHRPGGVRGGAGRGEGLFGLTQAPAGAVQGEARRDAGRARRSAGDVGALRRLSGGAPYRRANERAQAVRSRGGGRGASQALGVSAPGVRGNIRRANSLACRYQQL